VEVNVHLDKEVEAKIKNGLYQLDANDRRELWQTEKISKVWPEAPPNEQLHVVVTLPSPLGSSTVVDPVGECFIHLFALAQDI
jgi:hypothetical protein